MPVLVIVVIVVTMPVLVIVVIVVTMFVLVLVDLVLKLFELGGERVAVLHCVEYALAVQLRPRGGDDSRLGIALSYELYRGGELLVARHVCMAEHNAGGVLYLVVEEFAKVLHVHLALIGVDDRRHGIYLAVVELSAFDGLGDVRELAHARRLDEYSVGVIFGDHLFERLGEIADERTADTAGVELVDGYARLLHEAAVHAYFAEFVFD